MAEQNYAYAVARVRVKELSLLDHAFLEQLLAAADEQECLRLLQEKGWGVQDGQTDGMLEQEQEKTWQLMQELLEDISPFDVFLYQNDFHNLKAAVKENCIAGVHPGIFLDRGTVPVDTMKKALQDRDYTLLPENMQQAAQDASDILLKTRDGQLCDCIVDQAALRAVSRAGRESGNSTLALYGELTVAAANIGIAVRAGKARKSRDFLEHALAECETLDRDRLLEAGTAGPEQVYEYLRVTPYAEAVDSLAESQAAFEKWCDDLLIRNIRPQLWNPFGLGPLAAYVLARNSEIKNVRMILSGKKNGFSEEFIRGRIRETYV